MKKRNAPNADEILRQMYPDLMTSEDFEDKKDEKAAPDHAAQIAALQAKIDALESRSAEPRGHVPHASAPARPVEPVVDYSKAPDPVDDPKGYAAFVRQSTQAQIAYEKQLYQWEQQQTQTATNRTNALWTSFEEEHGDYAKDSRKVEIAAREVLSRKSAAGVDIDKYMYDNSDRFMRDVIKEYDGLFGKPQATDDADAGDDTGEDDDDVVDTRTHVVTGPAASRAPANVQKPPEKYGALSKQLIEFQQKSGFYR